MAPLAELNVTNFNVLVGKSEGRDKLARTVQFAARMIVGLTQLKAMKAGTRIYWVNELAGNIMKQLASARRAHRWCKEFPVIQAILRSLPTEIPGELSLSASEVADRALDLAQKVTLATFLVIDHLGWLKQMKVLSGGKRAGTGTIQLGLKYFCVSNFFSMLIQLKKQWEAPAEKKRPFTQNALKHGLLVLQCAHLSRMYESHDAIVGLFGVISSFMDTLAQWPERKAAPAPKPASEEKAAPAPKPASEEKVPPDAKASAPAPTIAAR